jgi:hypothetical protein
MAMPDLPQKETQRDTAREDSKTRIVNMLKEYYNDNPDRRTNKRVFGTRKFSLQICTKNEKKEV